MWFTSHVSATSLRSGQALGWMIILYRLIAIVAVVSHLAYLGFLGVGSLLALRFPRLLRLHLLAVGWAAISLLVRVDCPLTDLQKWAMRRAGDTPYSGGFIDHYLTGTIYPDSWKVVAGIVVGGIVVTGYAAWALRSPVVHPPSR